MIVTSSLYTYGMDERIRMLRAVLDEAAREIRPSTATQAKMAETIVIKAAEGATRDELKAAPLGVAKAPAA